jgi:hypothetical protein
MVQHPTTQLNETVLNKKYRESGVFEFCQAMWVLVNLR